MNIINCLCCLALIYSIVYCTTVNAAPIQMKYYGKNDSSAAHKSNYFRRDDGLKMVFLIHGCAAMYSAFKTDYENAKKTIFARKKDVGRVVLVDWSGLNVNCYPNVDKNVFPKIGDLIAKEISNLVKNGSIVASKIEIVGHSLGAHIGGAVGKKLRKQNIGPIAQITGLDPPEIKSSEGKINFFFGSAVPVKYQLSRGDANKVRVLHTNTIGFGSTATFDEDIYVNGGKLQPSCLKRKLYMHMCSHVYAWTAFVLELKGKNLTSSVKFKKSTFINILLLDVSPSMIGSRIENLVIASNRFVKGLPLGFKLGIVIFGGSANIAHPIVNISSDNIRNDLRKSLPEVSTVIEGTSIGAAIQLAIEMAGSCSKKNDSNIIVMTDGEETVRPYIDDIMPLIQKSCVQITAISLGPTASEDLEELTSVTKGDMYAVSDDTKNGNIFDKLTLAFLVSSESQLDPDDKQIFVSEKEATIDAKKPTVIPIDKSVGKDNRIVVSCRKVNEVEAELTSPDNKVYTNFIADEKNNELVFNVDDMEEGNWNLKVKTKTNTNSTRQRRSIDQNSQSNVATIIVSSKQRNKDEPAIRLNAFFSTNTIKPGDWVKVDAELRKGYRGIIDADVFVILTSQQGTKSTYKLLDNGVGADSAKNDGIYSRYISRFNETGRHEVIVNAINTENKAKLLPKSTDSNNNTPLVESFERLSIVGSLKAIGPFLRAPPIPVTDLRVVSINHDRHVCTLTWTASGDEFDFGTAKAFYLRVTHDYSNIDDIKSQYIFNEKDFEHHEDTKPKLSGEMQTVTVRIPDEIWKKATEQNSEWGYVELYFTVQTMGHDSKLSKVSNVASPYVLLEYKDESSGFSALLPFSFFTYFITFMIFNPINQYILCFDLLTFAFTIVTNIH